MYLWIFMRIYVPFAVITACMVFVLVFILTRKIEHQRCAVMRYLAELNNITSCRKYDSISIISEVIFSDYHSFSARLSATC